MLSGVIKLKKDPKSERFTLENVLLRDSFLKNTDWVIGFVLFANENCFNNQEAGLNFFRTHQLDKILNWVGFGIFIQIIMIALVSLFFSGFI